MGDTESGLAIAHLLKMKAKGHISLAKFLQLTAEVEGQHEERPITLDGTAAPAAADEAPAPAAAAAAVDEDEAEEDVDEDDEEEHEDAEEDDEEASPMPSGAGPSSAGAAAEEQSADETPPPAAKKQRGSMLSGSMLSFVTKNAPPMAKIASARKTKVQTYTPKKPVSEVRFGMGRGASAKKQGSRRTDVSMATMSGRVKLFPNQGLRIEGSQLFCAPCGHNIASGSEAGTHHPLARQLPHAPTPCVLSRRLYLPTYCTSGSEGPLGIDEAHGPYRGPQRGPHQSRRDQGSARELQGLRQGGDGQGRAGADQGA